MRFAQPRNHWQPFGCRLLIATSTVALLGGSALGKPVENAFDIDPPTEQKKTVEQSSIDGPARMKARIQMNARPAKGTGSDTDNKTSSGPSGGVRTTPVTITAINTAGPLSARGLDYDLYLRRYDDCKQRPDSQNSGTDSAWQAWTSKMLGDIHVLQLKTLTIPGYADFVVTVRSDGKCTAKLITLLGGPQFKQQALSLIDQMNDQRLLRYGIADHESPTSVSFKMGVGDFIPKGNEGHFWCGVESELPNAVNQLENRYAHCHQ